MKKNILILSFISVIIFGLLFAVNNFTLIGGQLGTPISEIDPSISWEFFENELLHPDEAKEAYGTGTSIPMPHYFHNYYETSNMYGTYVTKAKFPAENLGTNLAIYIPYQSGSYKLYANNQLINTNGVVGTSKDEQVPEFAPKIGQIPTVDEEITLTLQLSNFYSTRGGFSNTINIGQSNDILKEYTSSLIIHFFINGTVFIASIFALLFGIFNNRNKQTILFALLCLVFSIRSLFIRPYFYSITILNIPWEMGMKIEAICTILAISLAISFIITLLLRNRFSKLFWSVQSILAAQLFVILFTEPIVFQRINSYLIPAALLLLLFLLIYGVIKTISFTAEISVHLTGSFTVFIAAVHDSIAIQQGLNYSLLTHHALAVYVMLVCVLFSIQYAQKQKKELSLKNEILALNSSLDLKIKERTNQLEEANKVLSQLATRDALTGIANRYSFDIRIEEEFEKALTFKHDLSILMLDLDDFKKYNDYYGHVTGDYLLQSIVSTIKEQLPYEAFFARYGGEEFAIIYPNANEQQLSELGEKIVRAVAMERFEHVKVPNGYATISVGGYTMKPMNAFHNNKQLIAAADERLYRAKNNGKNQYVGKKSKNKME